MEDKQIGDDQREKIWNHQEDDIHLEKISFQEEDSVPFPLDLIQDSVPSDSEEQRQSLYQKILKMSTPQKIRLAILGNRETRNFLIHNPNKTVSLAVLKSPQLTENEVARYAQQKNLGEEIILSIAKNKKWIKNYPIRLAIISNPKTPLSVAINLLNYLHDNDLKTLSQDKGVSAVLSRTAYQVHLKRKSSK